MIRYSTKGEEARLIELFQLCFPGEEAFCTWFFQRIYQPEKTLVYEDGGKVLAMVHMLERTLREREKTYKASYLYAVATDPGQQGKGIMGKLLEAVFAENRKQQVDVSILITQNDALFAFYRRFGYRELFFTTQEQVGAKDSQLSIVPITEQLTKQCNAVYEKACATLLHAERTEQHWKEILQVYQPISYAALDEKGAVKAYAFGHLDGDFAVITEIMGDLIPQLAAQIAHDNGKIAARYMSLPVLGSAKPIGMLKPILSDIPVQIAYINLLYN